MTLTSLICTFMICAWGDCSVVPECRSLAERGVVDRFQKMTHETKRNFRVLSALQTRIEDLENISPIDMESRQARLRTSSWIGPTNKICHSLSDEGGMTRHNVPADTHTYSNHIRSGLDHRIDIQFS